jgi:excisionase family DNA binding protein
VGKCEGKKQPAMRADDKAANQKVEMSEEREREIQDEEAGERQGSACGEYPEVMTVKQAADYLQVNDQVLYRYVREGKVPVTKMGATIRFKKSVIDEWLTRESWESIGVTVTPGGKPRGKAEPVKPKMEMEID